MTRSPWWVKAAAVSLGVVRVALGTAALAFPEPAGKLWIGDGASGHDRAVLLRALGGRDLALGLGAVLSSRDDARLRRWVAMGAISDLVDTAATAAAFQHLPRSTRWLVLAASGGAAATGAAVATLLRAGD